MIHDKTTKNEYFCVLRTGCPPPTHFSMRETRIITTNNVCLTAVSLPHLDNKVSFIAPSYQLTDT